MFTPPVIPIGYWIEHVTFGLLCSMFRFSALIFYRKVIGFANDCPYGVWCRGLAICLWPCFIFVNLIFVSQIVLWFLHSLYADAALTLISGIMPRGFHVFSLSNIIVWLKGNAKSVPGTGLNIKMASNKFWNSYDQCNIVARPSLIYNGDPYTWKDEFRLKQDPNENW